MLLMSVIGLASCSEDLEQPPVINPDNGGGEVVYGTGTWDKPLGVNQLLGGEKGSDVWVTGYIVGWIDTKGGTVNKYNEETVTFTTPATLASNIVMAATPDEKDINKCIPVQLSGSIRSSLNLVDNPGNLGKQVTVKGSVEKYFGIEAALKNLSAFNWGDKGTQGGDNPNPPAGEGNGSAEKPYSVAQMLGGQSGTGVWVSGYIVGYIKSNTSGGASTLTAESATFSAEGAAASNMMLADSPQEKDYSKCTAVNLPTGAIRAALNLVDNPGNIGRQVSIKGDLSKYFGVNGLRNASEYNWGPTGTTGGGTTPSGDAIYTALGASDASLTSGWQFTNVKLPEGISDIFQWKEYNGNHYLNASAYVGGANFESEAYAYSPVIDLTGYKSVSATFDSAAKFQTTLTQLCKFVVREEGASAWTELSIPTWPAAGAWTFTSSGAIDLSVYAGKKVQIGFKYASTTAGADTWEIQNLKVSGSK